MDLLYTVIDWVKAGWAWLGWGNLEANILLLGIDNAGKTTLLHFLKTGMLKQNLPTRKPTMEELQMDNILFRAYDLGGNVHERPLWPSYFPLVDAVVYMVDIADVDRIEESRDALQQLFAEDSLNDVPFLIMANKIDLPTALSPTEVQNHLELGKVMYDRKVQLAMVSLVQKQGVKEAFDWLGSQLRSKK